MASGWDVSAAFLLAGALNGLVALLHVGIIVGGPSWYRFFGAGEAMAREAEEGKLHPAAVTSGIAFAFACCAAYALSGAGVLPPLPLRRAVLTGITAVYLARGVLAPPLMLKRKAWSVAFVLWTSAASATFGLVHLMGLLSSWEAL